MEQKSNVQYRAEKEYKNSREKFFLLLRKVSGDYQRLAYIINDY